MDRIMWTLGADESREVLDMVKRWQQNWKHSVVEMSSKRVIKRVYNLENPGRHPRRMPMNLLC